ncbi:hypothetical protein BDZ91DRAFT_716574 [Kalaharituber pfeilii]|nr:hypothetical protein BDZ91DRAFT_716574 [Kalaharituber pfeilii]
MLVSPRWISPLHAAIVNLQRRSRNINNIQVYQGRTGTAAVILYSVRRTPLPHGRQLLAGLRSGLTTAAEVPVACIASYSSGVCLAQRLNLKSQGIKFRRILHCNWLRTSKVYFDLVQG